MKTSKNQINPSGYIVARGVCEHNLHSVNVEIPRDKLTVITGVSGCGKSSLAFDTIYAEGQRRYLESLSSYARQFVDKLRKPKLEYIDGLSPAISIEQKTNSNNPRSTVGTVTEIYDYLRILFSTIGTPHCPQCGKPIERTGPEHITQLIMQWEPGTKFIVSAPVAKGRKGEYREVFEDARRQGFVRARVDGKVYDLNSLTKLRKNIKHDISIVIDRLIVQPGIEERLATAIDMALSRADGLVEIETVPDGKIRLFSIHFSCPDCNIGLEELSHRVFSFNSPQGWCPRCEGLGTLTEVDEDNLLPDKSLSIAGGVLTQWTKLLPDGEGADIRLSKWELYTLDGMAKKLKFSLKTPWQDLPEKIRDIVLNGSSEGFPCKVSSADGEQTWTLSFKWEGLIQIVRNHLDDSNAQALEQLLRDIPCPKCGGQKLKPAPRGVRLAGLNISEFCQMDITRERQFLANLELTHRQHLLGDIVLHEIMDRLQFLDDVGLHYLTLDRRTGTLSGGEAQRTRLATQIGSQLTGVLYVLDEPSIGLHWRDNNRLIETLKNLRDLGNTVIVVEHDETTIRSADYVLDLGPGPGRLGGKVVAAGPPKELTHFKQSLTGDYLAGRKVIPVPEQRRKPDKDKMISIIGATEHNLKNINVDFPLGLLIAVTGVSGSGKSTLINNILHKVLSNKTVRTHYRPGAYKKIVGAELIDKVICVDQSPIGRTPRSNPATYTGVFSPIRDLFAQLPESKARGYKPGRFSFNVRGGRCEHCKGDGLVCVEMQFLPDVYVECEFCGGNRYNRETLEVEYHGKNIAQVLQMTVEEARELFAAVPSIAQKLQTLCDVGLGYISLGQSSTTISGGEAQRVKLATELSRRSTGKTVYLLDEPTTGLHFHDVAKLLEVLERLVDLGNTVIIIEHNLDIIRSADWVIDLGPEGGADGGYIVGQGTPEQIANIKGNLTGQCLKALLKK
ncbi:excinuclease ABC subunit UvrA [Candidatus Sumerlaeota bacterium]|nr:excinuclease ABC subunit UvrA [Candidatus Sumerlaeota bacterium]